MKELSRRDFMIYTFATAGSLVLNGCETRLDPEKDPWWQKTLPEQGKRVEENLKRVGLFGELPLIDFSRLQPTEQQKLGVAPGTNGFFSFHAQNEDYILTRFVVLANNQPVIVGISTEKENLNVMEDLTKTTPTVNIRFDLSKFIRYIPQNQIGYNRDLRKKRHQNVQYYPHYGAFSTVVFDNPQQYVNEPDAILDVSFKGQHSFAETVRELAAKRK